MVISSQYNLNIYLEGRSPLITPKNKLLNSWNQMIFPPPAPCPKSNRVLFYLEVPNLREIFGMRSLYSLTPKRSASISGLAAMHSQTN
ncbi:MAG: hypothetical protein V7K68_16530 [Nostoc sp.]|uniref:hypothetical protein n=1 Tax=Nostoc sp. TaxID=1180 RepID=UPI002FF96228